MGLIDDLKEIALQIKNETNVGANTASKVGELIYNIVDVLSEHDTDINNPNADVNPGITSQVLTDDLDLLASHRYCSLSSESAVYLILDVAGSCIGRKHTIVNTGAVGLKLQVQGDDHVNNGDEYEIKAGEAVTVMALSEYMWYVIYKI